MKGLAAGCADQGGLVLVHGIVHNAPPPLLTAQVGRGEVPLPLPRPQTLLEGVPGVPDPLQLAGCAPNLPRVDGIERPPLFVAPPPPAESLVSGFAQSQVPLPPSGGPLVEYWFPGVPAPL